MLHEHSNEQRVCTYKIMVIICHSGTIVFNFISISSRQLVSSIVRQSVTKTVSPAVSQRVNESGSLTASE
jgi:hypothetical protein